MSVMEMSHRNKQYTEIWNNARTNLAKLLGIPDTHQIFFLQGGAYLQFSAVPMNLLGNKKTANYFVTGHWSEQGFK